MNLAVVGSGIAGVLSAYLLDRKYDVTLYEKNERLGGHAHTVEVTLDGRTEPVDTGFLVYNERNYPTFSRFLDELDVATKPSSMSFSFRCERSEVEYGGHGLSAFFSQWKNLFRPEHWKMLGDIVRFYRSAGAQRTGVSLDVTLRDYLEDRNYSQAFIRDHLLPMVASIWSVPVSTAGEFPFGYIVDFFENHGLLQFYGRPQWRTIDGGSRSYLRRFRESFQGKILVDNPVKSIRRDSGKVRVGTEENDRSYDSVVLAVHSDQALDLLADPGEKVRKCLGSIPFESNELVLHTDPSLLPEDRTIWSSWNYHRLGESDSATLTYDVSILQDLGFDEEVCLTLNADGKIDPGTEIDRFRYDHPVYSTESLRARKKLEELNGKNGIYFAGAWVGNGFHEDGARSALTVARELGVDW